MAGTLPPDPLPELGRLAGAGEDLEHNPSAYLGTASFCLDRWVRSQLAAAQALGWDTAGYHQALSWAEALRRHWHPAVRIGHGQSQDPDAQP